MTRQINDAALSLIKSFESCSLTPYQDSGGVWTIGWGNTEDVTADSATISQETADSLLESDLTNACDSVQSHIHADLNDNQFGALVSLVYNCGTAPLLSPVGQHINANEFDIACQHWLLWNKTDGVVSDGLTRRRQAEVDLFNAQ